MSRLSFVLFQYRQGFHNPRAFNTHADDALDQINDVARVAVLGTPVVRVVLDAAGLV